MWMSVKCFPECASMANASTPKAPSSASALQEWLLMSAAGCALVRTVSIWYQYQLSACVLCVYLCAPRLPDLRTEQCYLTHEDERCGTPISGRHRVDACCCSVGVAWGPECDECPEKGTPEYTQLCPRGPGFSHRGDFINGRPFLKGIVPSRGRPSGSFQLLILICLSFLSAFYLSVLCHRYKWMQDDKRSVLKWKV